MRLTLFVAAALLIASCHVASADYLILKMDLNEFLAGGLRPPLFVIPKQPQKNPGFGGQGGFGGQQGFNPPPVQGGGTPDQPGRDPAKSAVKLPPLYIYAHYEIRPDKKLYPEPRPQYFKIDVKPLDQKTTTSLHLTGKYTQVIPTGWNVAADFVLRFDKIAPSLRSNADDDKKRQMGDLAEWALQRGLLVEFKKCIDELKKSDPKHAVVASVEAMAQKLQKGPTVDDPGAKALMEELLQKHGYRSSTSEQGHYTLLTNIKTSAREDEPKRKLAKLETLYTTFFTWHALKGRPLPLPNHRLVVVLVDAPPNSPKDFLKRHVEFGSLPMVGAGFTAQRDNVVFLASNPLDETYVKLDAFNQEEWSKHSTSLPEIIANFETLKKNLERVHAATPELFLDKFGELLELHMLSLCQKSMEDESENLTLSHEGVRQLAAATGLLPRDLKTSEWARCGLASFFEIPPKAFFPSTGGANWNHLVRFKALEKTNKIDKQDATDLLLDIVSDDMLRDAYDLYVQSLRSKEDKEKLGPLAKEELELARALCWSLVHFLSHKRDKEFGRYLELMRSLPRDVEYDGKVLRNCFLRAFNLLTDNPEKPGQPTIKAGELDTLSQEWFRHTERFVSLDSEPYELFAVTQLAAPPKTLVAPASKGPGGSGGPGGKIDPPGAGGKGGGTGGTGGGGGGGGGGGSGGGG